MKSFLILSHQGIGDIISSLPIYRSIKKKYPDSFIVSTVKSDTEGLILKKYAKIDRYIISNFHEMSVLKSTLWLFRFCFKKYDFVIAPVGINVNYALILYYLSRSKRLIATCSDNCNKRYKFFFIRVSGKAKKVYNNIQIAKVFDNFASIPVLTSSSNYYESKKFKDQNFIIGLHPGSGHFEKHKRWPAKKYAELINLINLNDEYNYTFFIFGVKSEMELCDSILLNLKKHKNVFFMCGKTSFDETLSVVSKCKLFISADSGMMHVAAALGLQTVSIFGPTSHIEISPYWNNSFIINKNLPCSPCYPAFVQGCKNPICVSEISAKEVYELLLTEGLLCVE